MNDKGTEQVEVSKEKSDDTMNKTRLQEEVRTLTNEAETIDKSSSPITKSAKVTKDPEPSNKSSKDKEKRKKRRRNVIQKIIQKKRSTKSRANFI